MLELSFGEVVVCVIVDLAQVYQLEIGDKIFPKDEEHSVCVGLPICVDIVQCLFLGWSEAPPKGFIIVAGSAFPLLVAPGVSQFDHSLGVVVDAELN